MQTRSVGSGAGIRTDFSPGYNCYKNIDESAPGCRTECTPAAAKSMFAHFRRTHLNFKEPIHACAAFLLNKSNQKINSFLMEARRTT
jgi:hypothetical protein